MPLQVLPGLVVPDAAMTWRFSRSSGPGGQSVNTTDSRAELTVELAEVLEPHLLERAVARLGGTTLTTQASDERSQLQNRALAAERMVEQIRQAIAPPPAPRRPTRPTKGSKERRLETKRQRSQLKQQRRAPDP